MSIAEQEWQGYYNALDTRYRNKITELVFFLLPDHLQNAIMDLQDELHLLPSQEIWSSLLHIRLGFLSIEHYTELEAKEFVYANIISKKLSLSKCVLPWYVKACPRKFCRYSSICPFRNTNGI